MELYLLKFSGCLLVFWLLYVLLLEKQQMHRFKRFYLLGSFVVALVIPQLTIIEYIEPIVQNYEVSNAFIPIEAEFVPQPINEAPVITLEAVLWTIYTLGVLLFSARFAINLHRLYRSISKNSTYKDRNFIYVLLTEYRIPHSFFTYIFVNQNQFENNQIPEEVKLHEETHAKQLHSLDILLLELLQIVFWFHPLVYILKHHVKLNHEFLADDAVLQQGVATKNYQNILLQFSSNTHNHQLASAINYSSFKKRFTVMKTQTSKTRIWLSTLLVLPVLALLFYSFAEREYVEKNKPETNSFLVFVEKNGNTLELRCESGCRWSHLVLEPNSEPYIINDFGFSEGNTLDTDKFAFSIAPNQSGVLLNGLKGTAWVDLAFSLPKNQKQAVNQMGMTNETANINEKKVEKVITIKAINNSLFIDNKKSSLDTYVKDLNKITENWTEEDFDLTRFDLKTENCSQSFLDNLNELHKKTDHFLITVIGSKAIGEELFGKIENQQKATKQQIDDYNAWAKKMSAAIKEAEENSKRPYPVINKKEYKKYYNIYRNLMSEEQRANAEAWPNIPPPPPPPPAPELPKKSSKGGPNASGVSQTNKIQPIEIYIDSDNNIQLNGKRIKEDAINTQVAKLNKHLTKEDHKKYVMASITIEKNKSADLAKSIQSKLKEVNVFCGSISYFENVSKTNLPKKSFNLYSGLTLEEAKAKEKKIFSNSADTEKKIDSINKSSSPWKVKTTTASYEFIDDDGNSTGKIPINLNEQTPQESTLDFVIKMAKKDAKFFSEGKPISSDEAIALIKKNNKLNVNAYPKSKEGKPLVYITKKPVVIKTKE